MFHQLCSTTQSLTPTLGPDPPISTCPWVHSGPTASLHIVIFTATRLFIQVRPTLSIPAKIMTFPPATDVLLLLDISVTLMSSRYVYRVHHLTVASDHANVSIKFKGPFNCSDCVPCQLSCSLMCCLTQQRPLLSAAPHPKRPLPVVERYPRPCRRQ